MRTSLAVAPVDRPSRAAVATGDARTAHRGAAHPAQKQPAHVLPGYTSESGPGRTPWSGILQIRDGVAAHQADEIGLAAEVIGQFGVSGASEAWGGLLVSGLLGPGGVGLNAAYLRERPRDAEEHAASEQPGGCLTR